MSARIEPEWEMVTVLFVDIRGFTSFADRSTAREAVEYLNEFFGLVVPIVAAHGGHVNKLLGDGLLGVFGAPSGAPTTRTERWRPPRKCSRLWSRTSASGAGSGSGSTPASCSWAPSVVATSPSTA